MKYLIIVLSLLLSGCANSYYAKVGAGYKLQESQIDWYDGSSNDPISARMEVGAKSGPIIYGLSHRSQYFTGTPFNSKSEYHVNEIFVDYEWQF